MKVIMAGFGTVGQGVAKVIEEKNSSIKKRLGEGFEIVGVSDSKGAIYNPEGLNLELLLKIKREKGAVISYPDVEKLKSNEELINREADVLIEVTPTDIESGRAVDDILYAFRSKKHVVTSNKGPLTLNFKGLNEEAAKNGCMFYYTATVGGCTRMIDVGRGLSNGAAIISFQGILNGTSNYILSRMTDEEAPYELILREAQQLGYAETDPSHDVDGIDTACKLVILANSVMGLESSLKDVKIEGITGISEDGVKLAKSDGKVIKLIGEIEKSRLEVSPRLVPKGHFLDISGTLNLGLFKTDFAGDIAIMGRGAGQMETASAILGDLNKIISQTR